MSYWYNAIPLDEEDLALPPDELIDRYIAAAGSPYDRQVRLDHDDLRARDVFNRWLRGRLLVSDTHLYSMAMHSKDPALLTGEDAERFFASFHRFESESN